MTEVPLPGGLVNHVVRVGDTVLRPQGGGATFVHRLLGLFEQQGWLGAPPFLGVDDLGREILGFLEGHVAWVAQQPPEVGSDQSLVAVACLVRQFHDLTAGTLLAGEQEVVCHNDLSPKNTVYRKVNGDGLRPAAFIDWDLAAPGARIHDLAQVAWQFVGLGPGVVEIREAGRRVRLICEAYGLTDRSRVIETVLWWQDRCWRGIDAAATVGVPAMVRLRDGGGLSSVRQARDWVVAHRLGLEAAL